MMSGKKTLASLQNGTIVFAIACWSQVDMYKQCLFKSMGCFSSFILLTLSPVPACGSSF